MDLAENFHAVLKLATVWDLGRSTLLISAWQTQGAKGNQNILDYSYLNISHIDRSARIELLSLLQIVNIITFPENK